VGAEKADKDADRDPKIIASNWQRRCDIS